jgi:hypothetical protein
MASIRKEIVINARPEKIWDAVRDVGAIHTRLAPGFVVDTRLEEGARVVTFGNGLVARELIVDRDDERAVWRGRSSAAPRLTHHNASLQVIENGHGGSRVVWIADLLPNEGRAGDPRHDRARHGGDEEDAGGLAKRPADPRQCR